MREVHWHVQGPLGHIIRLCTEDVTAVFFHTTARSADQNETLNFGWNLALCWPQELTNGLSCAQESKHGWSREAQAQSSMCVGMHAWVACIGMRGGWAGGVGRMLTLLLRFLGSHADP